MATVETLDTWTWTIIDDQLVPRAGRVILDAEPGEFVSHCDTLGPLHVRAGLIAGDIALFLSFTSDGKDDDLPIEPVGYLVTHIDEPFDGSGIIVSGELVESSPKDWMTQRLLNAWVYVLGEGNGPDEFELPAVAAYVANAVVALKNASQGTLV